MTTEVLAAHRPDWLAAEMPPGYRNRLEEIQRLSREIEEFDRFGRLLCTVGPELGDAVRETLVALNCDVTPASGSNGSAIVVKLDGMKRLLLLVSASKDTIRRRSDDLAHVFQMLHQIAGNGDRVVLVANNSPSIRPSDRGDGVDAEAVGMLKRLGANYVSAPTLFALWSTSLQSRDRARAVLDSLHAQDGGVFVLPALVGV